MNSGKEVRANIDTFADMVTKPINANQSIKVSYYVMNILRPYIFRPLLWPSSGRWITKNGFIDILQKFVTKCADVKY